MVDFLIFFKTFNSRIQPFSLRLMFKRLWPNLPHTRGKKHPSGKQESHEFVLVTEGHFDLNSINLLCKIRNQFLKT